MAHPSISALEVHAVNISFAGVAAVSDVDLTANAAEVHGLVGPNGSGKTTLLNSISGFVRPQSGTIHVFGHDITRTPSHRRVSLGVGRTFQSPMLLSEATVLDLLEMGLYLRDPRSFWASAFRPFWVERQRRSFLREAGEVLERVGLSQTLIDEDLASLSHGQMKMVDVARALLGRPRLLLLDEPAAGLSEEETAVLQSLIVSLKDEGVAVLVVEHNVQFVLGLSDRVTVLDQGRVLAAGEPHATLSRPDVVAAYLGTRAARRADQTSQPEEAQTESSRSISP